MFRIADCCPSPSKTKGSLIRSCRFAVAAKAQIYFGLNAHGALSFREASASCSPKGLQKYRASTAAVEATIAVEVVQGQFDGTITACTTSIPQSLVLYDSKLAGVMTGCDDNQSIQLLRPVVAVCMKEMLEGRFANFLYYFFLFVLLSAAAGHRARATHGGAVHRRVLLAPAPDAALTAAPAPAAAAASTASASSRRRRRPGPTSTISTPSTSKKKTS
ncbi:hypothetical protein EJB05_54961 [Eragrostis curvula]|uniref:DUF6598 domain-containing protein n=1 Tax=Eragrostis curvula TaxID=38414 RepID=A0A5J9SL89_9POAL|nr:hypothetical protein EJB05_54961 [Eragrostis curvula]